MMYLPLPLEIMHTDEIDLVWPLRTLAGVMWVMEAAPGEDGSVAGKMEMLKSDEATRRTREEGKNSRAVIVEAWVMHLLYGAHCT